MSYHEVPVSIGRIKEIHEAEYLGSNNVLEFLENWCFMNLLDNFTADIDVGVLLFKFRDPKEAVLFKLTWG